MAPRRHAALASALILALIGRRAAAQTTNSSVENSVVKVFSTVLPPDPYRPWSKQAPTEVTGSGVVIEGRRILTNAHVVLYASQIQVQANQAGDKVSATVETIGPDMDLAVLKLEDQAFFDSHPPLPRTSTLPEVKETVLAYGFPLGGDTLSITRGIVSRIEFANYGRFVGGLRVQIDAAINAGNSGGPAMVGDRMIGLAFSHLGKADNIGYIIPTEEVDLFLRDVADGRYDGKPIMLGTLQTLENDALRAFLKLDKTVEGIVVHQVESDDPAYPLKEWDLITKIGDTRVDDQGMIPLGPNLRVSFRYRVQQLAKNGKVPLTVVRGAREVQVELPVSPSAPVLIPDLQGAYPSYFVYGPVVFSDATGQFLAGFASSGANMTSIGIMTGPLFKRVLDKPAFEGERLVVISSPLFPHRLSKGYGNPISRVVKAINGVRIRNLAHLVEVLRDTQAEFITIEVDGRGGESLVFRRSEVLAATDEILTNNGVRHQGSPDALAAWERRP